MYNLFLHLGCKEEPRYPEMQQHCCIMSTLFNTKLTLLYTMTSQVYWTAVMVFITQLIVLPSLWPQVNIFMIATSVLLVKTVRQLPNLKGLDQLKGLGIVRKKQTVSPLLKTERKFKT